MNKKIFNISLILIFISATFFSSCKTDGDKKNPDVKDTTSVKVVKAPELLNYKQPKELKYIKKNRDVIYDKFFPIGYSSAGLFAYMTLPADEATGYFQYSFVIQNLETNKIVWSKKIDYNDKIEKGSLRDTWKKNYEKFKEELNKNNIVQDKKINISKFPSPDSENLNLIFDLKYEEDSYGFGFDVVAKVTAKIKSNSIAAKQIYEKSYTESMILNVMSPGYIQMPKINYIACIINTEQRGFEGPPNVILLKVIGVFVE